MNGHGNHLVQPCENARAGDLAWLDHELQSSEWMGRSACAAPLSAPLLGERAELLWALGGTVVGVIGYVVAALL